MTTTIARQYAAIKLQYPDCLLLFVLDNCYYAIDDDATTIAMTVHTPIPRAMTLPTGEEFRAWTIPHADPERCIPNLVAAGYRVAICEQIPPNAEWQRVGRGAAPPHL